MSATESQTKPGGIGQKAQAAAHAAAESIKSRATEAASQLKGSASNMVEERREQVAGKIGSVGSALDETARSVEGEDPNIAWLTQQAATRLQNAAEYVRTCSWDRLRDDGADFARRHPLAFFGGMFALGAVAGAVIKAGMQSAVSESDDTMASRQNEMDYVPPPSDVTVSPGTEEPFTTPTATI